MRSLLSILGLAPLLVAAGITCDGSALCLLATLENKSNEGVMQGMRDALKVTNTDPNTMFNAGEHIMCISTTIGIDVGIKGLVTLSAGFPAGGICLFAEKIKQPISLATVRDLVDALLDHHCTTCGNVPIHFVDQHSNDGSSGILKFDYVHDPTCTHQCIGQAVGGGSNQNTPAATKTVTTTQQQQTVQTVAKASTVAVPTTTGAGRVVTQSTSVAAATVTTTVTTTGTGMTLKTTLGLACVPIIIVSILSWLY
ncbi:hypothetical protein AMS68_005156 [Peltaster fructicola]|uniref:Killer toxin Kp4 domain-containing protein n=1 Tax=Peltaster fructicola TaxID=286661 RepID=A0A6H0XYE3_9PEZI|nr:hypothetical protein AMS68_005156 [Peltaster fructicola]